MKNYKIDTEVFAGTDKMKEYGSLGRAVVRIVCDGDIIVELRDIYIRATKSGEPFVAYPSQKDKNGKKNEMGKDIYYPYYKMFPESKELYERINSVLLDKFNKLGNSPASSTPAPKQAPKMSQPKPVTTPVANGTEEFNFS
jgi:DNA-binding cell septation regulator SpoVG